MLCSPDGSDNPLMLGQGLAKRVRGGGVAGGHGDQLGDNVDLAAAGRGWGSPWTEERDKMTQARAKAEMERRIRLALH